MARIIAIVLMLVAAVTITVSAAQGKAPTTVPGWGNGNTDKTHTGPPGGTSVRPGNGNGDTNHTHTGAPGKP